MFIVHCRHVLQVGGLSEAMQRKLAAPLSEAVVSFCSQAKFIKAGEGMGWTQAAGGGRAGSIIGGPGTAVR